eukprot:PhM_4_TR13091/c0_g1_i1/m.5725
MGSGATKEKVEMARKTKVLVLEKQGIDNYDKWGKIFSEKVNDLRSLDLRSNKLKGVMPMSFLGSLKFLKKLDLSHNHDLSDVSAVCFLPALESLTVTHTAVKKLHPAQGPNSGAVSAITSLNMSHNKITEVSPTIFSLMPKLRVLDLSHNQLTVLPDVPGKEGANDGDGESEGWPLPSLESLSLNSNRLSSLPTGWSSCRELREVDVRDNALSAVPPKLILHTKLFKLEYSGNERSGLTLDSLKAMVEYETLQRRHQNVVNKGIQGGLVVKLGE